MQEIYWNHIQRKIHSFAKKIKREKILKAITYDKVLRKQPRKKPRQITTANSHGKLPQVKINQRALILFIFIHISNRNASNQRVFYIIFIQKKHIFDLEEL